MAAKLTPSLQRREMIGIETFSQRRDVFDQHDTVFLPPTSPVTLAPGHDVEPIVTTNQGVTASNFIRNGPSYSSMRERDHPIEFRPRKYSDLASEGISDEDFRASLRERTMRLSKLRKEFLKSNLHDTGGFERTGVRASMPTKGSPLKYKIESPNLYKFPFAEPYTPTATRRILSLETDSEDKDKETEETDSKHQSAPTGDRKADHQKLFEELLKRYSPQRKPVDWTLPPTKPRIVGTVPKAVEDKEAKDAQGEDKTDEANANGDDSKTSDDSETRDKMTELRTEINWNGFQAPEVDAPKDLSIPAIIEKMNADGTELESHKNDQKKVKRKRSFLDKVLGRNKNK